jgi:23S rRNA (cytidine1920-2'-O)/16S rRNA (cytidine1409-2'-O)-methyltransferase
MTKYASRAGEKLQFALNSFSVSPKDLICADFGCSTGGFTDCLLQNGAAKVYAIDTAYGELAWTLRNDPRVVVMERTNALFVDLPEKMDIITVDTGWTKQSFILPSVLKNLTENGKIISLIKPHYEAPREYIRKGRLMDEKMEETLEKVKKDIESLNLQIEGRVESPILGEKGKNKEYLALLSMIRKNNED